MYDVLCLCVIILLYHTYWIPLALLTKQEVYLMLNSKMYICCSTPLEQMELLHFLAVW